YRAQQPGAQRARHPQQPHQRRPPLPRQPAGRRPGGHGLTARAGVLAGPHAVSASLPLRVMTWLAPTVPRYRWVATMIVRPAIGPRMTSSIDAAAVGARWAVGS